MYCDVIDSIIQPDLLLIQASILPRISSKASFNLNLLFIIVFVDELK